MSARVVLVMTPKHTGAPNRPFGAAPGTIGFELWRIIGQCRWNPQVSALTLVDVETTSPPPGHVRIAVAACGVCGTDHAFVTGGFPGLTWPLTPGHEIAGTVAELGDGVEGFAVGDRVAVGWFGGNCNRCVPCRKGQFMQCVQPAGAELALSGRLRRIGDRARRRRWPASPTSCRSPRPRRWAAPA